MRRLHERLIIGIAVSCLGGVTAAAQTRSQEEGAPPWRLSSQVGVVYSDNRDGTKTNKQSNLDGTVEPRLDIHYQDADRTSVQLSLMPLLKWHSNPRTTLEGGAQDDTDLFGAAELDLMHRLTPGVKLDVKDRLAYNDDPRVMEGGSTLRRNESYLYNDLRAGLDSSFTAETGLGLSGEGVTTRYQDSVVAKELDSDLYRGEIAPYVMVGGGWKVIGIVGASEFQQEKTERNRGSAVETYQAGGEKTFSPGFVGRVLGGYQSIQYDNSGLDPEGTMSGTAELVLRSTSATRFRLSTAYGFFPPSDSDYSAQKATAFSWGVDHDVLADRLTLHFQGLYMDGHYTREAADAPGGRERMTTLGIHGTYFLSRSWSLTGGYALENWDSKVRESFTRQLVDMSVRAAW